MESSPKKSSALPTEHSSPSPSPISSPTPIRKSSTIQNSEPEHSVVIPNNLQPPLSSNAVSSLQPNDLTSSPRPRHTNFLRVINGAIEESLTIINTNQLGTIFENSLRQEFEGLPELVTHLQGALKTSLQQSVQQTFNEFQLIEKLSSLDSKINKAKKNNFTFPNNFENLMSNPVLIDLEVQYEAYSSALDELNKQLKQSEDKLMNEKIQYQLKIKEWETLSAQRNMKELEIEKILSPALALDFSIIEESLSL